METTHHICFCLKEVMKKKHISKNKLCRLTGLRFETIQGYYLGTISRVDLYVLSQFCNVLNCNVEDILRYQKQNDNLKE